jgi:hypothetical protein
MSADRRLFRCPNSVPSQPAKAPKEPISLTASSASQGQSTRRLIDSITATEVHSRAPNGLRHVAVYVLRHFPSLNWARATFEEHHGDQQRGWHSVARLRRY